MPIRQLTTDYTGREKDINIFSTDPRLTGPQPVSPSFGKVSSYCAGVQKLIQRYAVVLLTVKGSQPNYPSFGTDFLNRISAGNLMITTDLTHAFNFANAEVVTAFRREQQSAPSRPTDEQLDTAVLQSIVVSPTRDVQFNIAIYTAAGNTYDFVLPIPFSTK